MDIKYKVRFFSDWHCGSGLAAGTDLDALVVKDNNKLPYIPGKTIKGLIRSAVEDIMCFRGENNTDLFYKVFGCSADNELSMKGESFFTNVELICSDKEQIIEDNISEYLYRKISSTMIDDKGIAKEHSLRKIQTVVPCSLVGKIINVPNGAENMIEDGLKFIKRLGLNRNRGLGRCEISIIERNGGDECQ